MSSQTGVAPVSSAVAPPTAEAPLLELAGAWKVFGHVEALRDVDLTLGEGEVLALVGDNGAGKSTIVKVLSGVYNLDGGEFRIRGQAVHGMSPHVARAQGVATVFQDLALVETLDVTANIFLGQPITRGLLFANRGAMADAAAATLQSLKVRLPSVRVAVGELSGGQRQGVAIGRAIHQDTPIVLMDEPTAALGVRETAQIRDMILELKARGKSVILVSHDMGLVFETADRIQVMRLGQVHGVRRTAATDRQEIVGLITGALDPDPRPAPEGKA